MDLKQLMYFVTVVEEGSITAAAKRLHLSQPPLSHQMKCLEQELGLQLMERGARHITLTAAGKVFYQRAQNLLQLADSTQKEMRAIRQGLAGTLTLGACWSSGSELLTTWFSAFHNRFPNICFELFEGNTLELIGLLNANVIEIALVRTPFKEERDARYEKIRLLPEPMVVYGTKEMMQGLPQNLLSLKDLENKPLVTYRRRQEPIYNAFSKYGIQPLFLCKSDDARTTRMWASAGLGIAIIPRSALPMVHDSRMVHAEIDEKDLVSQLCAIWKKDQGLSAIAKSFLEIFDSCK